MSRIVAVIVTLCFAGCGLKGPLVLPPGPAPEPLFGSPKPVPRPTADAPAGTATTSGADVSTDKKTPTE